MITPPTPPVHNKSLSRDCNAAAGNNDDTTMVAMTPSTTASSSNNNPATSPNPDAGPLPSSIATTATTSSSSSSSGRPSTPTETRDPVASPTLATRQSVDLADKSSPEPSARILHTSSSNGGSSSLGGQRGSGIVTIAPRGPSSPLIDTTKKVATQS